MKRNIPAGILIAVICSYSIAAQNAEPPEKAFVSNAYGKFNEENVRYVFDVFFVEISERKGSKGIVAIYGPIKELADRKQVMANHVRIRNFNSALIEYDWSAAQWNRERIFGSFRREPNLRKSI